MMDWKILNTSTWHALLMYDEVDTPFTSLGIYFTEVQIKEEDYRLTHNGDMVAIVPKDMLPDKIKKQLEDIAAGGAP